MALVQAAQLGRVPQQPKEDTMTKILRGVQLANSVMETYGNYKKLRGADDLAKQAAEDRTTELDLKKAQTEKYKAETANVGKEKAMTPFERRKLALEEKKFAAETGALNDPKMKLSKMSGETQGKVGSIASGYRALDQIDAAINSGYLPQHIDANSKLVGQLMSDTPLTVAQRTLSEVVGRLQSGGAIGKEEEIRFNAMGPRPGDSKEIALKKLEDQKQFLDNKLVAFGLNSSDLDGIGFGTRDEGLRKLLSEKNNQPTNTQKAAVMKSGNPNKPDVKQNGVTFSWDPSANEYRPKK